MKIEIQCDKCKHIYTIDTEKDLDWRLSLCQDDSIDVEEQDCTFTGTWNLYCGICEDNGDDSDMTVSFDVDVAAKTRVQTYAGYNSKNCTVLTDSIKIYCPIAGEDQVDRDIKSFFGYQD